MFQPNVFPPSRTSSVQKFTSFKFSIQTFNHPTNSSALPQKVSNSSKITGSALELYSLQNQSVRGGVCTLTECITPKAILVVSSSLSRVTCTSVRAVRVSRRVIVPPERFSHGRRTPSAMDCAPPPAESRHYLRGHVWSMNHVSAGRRMVLYWRAA